MTTSTVSSSQSDTAPATPAVLSLMNQHYSRSAGRWCEMCGQHGSHHTNKHDFYVSGLMKRVEYSQQR